MSSHFLPLSAMAHPTRASGWPPSPQEGQAAIRSRHSEGQIQYVKKELESRLYSLYVFSFPLNRRHWSLIFQSEGK